MLPNGNIFCPPHIGECNDFPISSRIANSSRTIEKIGFLFGLYVTNFLELLPYLDKLVKDIRVDWSSILILSFDANLLPLIVSKASISLNFRVVVAGAFRDSAFGSE